MTTENAENGNLSELRATHSITLPLYKWQIILKELDRAAARGSKDVARKAMVADLADHIRRIIRKQQESTV